MYWWYSTLGTEGAYSLMHANNSLNTHAHIRHAHTYIHTQTDRQVVRHTDKHTHTPGTHIHREKQTKQHTQMLKHTHKHSLSQTHPQTLSLSLSQTHTAHTQKLCSNFDPPGRQAHYHLQFWLSFWEITISLYCVPRDNSCSLQKALSYFQRDESWDYYTGLHEWNWFQESLFFTAAIDVYHLSTDCKKVKALFYWLNTHTHMRSETVFMPARPPQPP